MKNSALLFLSAIALSLGVLFSSFTTKTELVKPVIMTSKATSQAQLYLSNTIGSNYSIYLFVPDPDLPYPLLGVPSMGMSFAYGITTMSNILPGTYHIVITGALSGASVTFKGVTKTVDSRGRIAFLDATLADGDYPGVYLNSL
ncbi:hypothetical protein [Pedobacter nyackensis]|uniref:hypothetical protein n=1 Tax=Pedobacter nyackensis TaxID=475255 RepID=UPI00292EC099|nr:hypothetical protein [Pedobacter nyackensis]